MTLHIRHAEFIRAVTRLDQAPPPLPAVVFAGRSNVGKSSLINKLVGRHGLARTSNTPGRTREIHYYDIEERYYFIDLPGYGYAKVAREIHHHWGPMIERFLSQAEQMRLVVVILDARRDPTPEDLQIIEWLEHRGAPFIFAVTKCDKLSRSQITRHIVELQRALGLEDDSALVPVSAQTGQGVEDLLRVIRAALKDTDDVDEHGRTRTNTDH